MWFGLICALGGCICLDLRCGLGLAVLDVFAVGGGFCGCGFTVGFVCSLGV